MQSDSDVRWLIVNVVVNTNECLSWVMFSFKNLALLFWCSVLSQVLHGQPLLQTERLTDFHGLSDNRVTCFLKDRAGYMWIGTENGLNRYDGSYFQIYRPGKKHFNLSHEHINDVDEDNTGRLWIGTWNGLNVLDPQRDSLYVFTPDGDIALHKKTRIASSIIWDVHIDQEQRVWLALDGRDLCYYDTEQQMFFYLPWKKFATDQLELQPTVYCAIQKIARKSDHELWLGTTQGLFSVDTENQEFQFYGGDSFTDCASLQIDSKQRVIMAQNKLYVADGIGNKVSVINEQSVSLKGKSNLLVPGLTQLWLVDAETMMAGAVHLQDKRPFDLHHSNVTAVFYDGQLTWIGTADGIRLYDGYRTPFHYISVFPDTTKTIGGQVYDVFDDEENDCYFVSSYTGNCLIQINKNTGSRKTIKKINGIQLSKCTKLFQDSNKRLWILTATHIFRSDPSKSKFTTIDLPDNQNHPDEYLFTDIVEDNNGNFWIASLRYGVYQLDNKTSTWQPLTHQQHGIFASRPTSLLYDNTTNELWISDFSFGAFQYSIGAQKGTYHGMDTEDSTLLQSALVNDLTRDMSGHIWLATRSGGISKYIGNKKFVTFSMKQGLLENTAHALTTDLNGNVWVASSKGLTHIDSNGNLLRHYDARHGLSTSVFTTPFSTNSKGEIFIGMSGGFIQFHPDSLNISSPPFPVVITHWQATNAVTNEPAQIGDQKSFTYKENEFTFHFAALTYSLPKEVTYHYKLEGFDKQWHALKNIHVAHFTNLSDGTYTFKVKAIDHTGRTSSNVAVITFNISPPFWKTSWFIICIGLLIVFVGWSWYKKIKKKILTQQLVNQLATSLYSEATIEDVFWRVARFCIETLQFEDCVVYLLQEDRGVLTQKAAAGPKSIEPYQVNNPIEIPLGSGIVGTVALTGVAEIIGNTQRDKRYIVDDQPRLSEIAVPILVEGKVFGVIDSEHRSKNFYSRWHLRVLKEVAAICTVKIGRYFIEEQIRSKVARDLHDDMGSTLSSINIMSNIALQKNDPEFARHYLQSIKVNAGQMQERMSDMVWAINPENDTFEKVIVRMKAFTAEILEPLNINYCFEEDGDFSHTRLDLSSRKDFFLIFKEAINNAAKYSNCTDLNVELRKFPGGITLSIRDNGKGFDLNLTPAGNGLRNMQHRAQSIKASIQIESVPQQGTSVFLQMPV